MRELTQLPSSAQRLEGGLEQPDGLYAFDLGTDVLTQEPQGFVEDAPEHQEVQDFVSAPREAQPASPETPVERPRRAPRSPKAPRQRRGRHSSESRTGRKLRYARNALIGGLAVFSLLSLEQDFGDRLFGGGSAGVDLSTVTVKLDNKDCSSDVSEMSGVVLSQHDEHTVVPGVSLPLVGQIWGGVHVQSGSVNINKDVPTFSTECTPGNIASRASVIQSNGENIINAPVLPPEPSNVGVADLSVEMCIPATSGTPKSAINSMVSKYMNDAVHGHIDACAQESGESGFVVNDATSADAHETEHQLAAISGYVQGYPKKIEREVEQNAATAIRQDLKAQTIYHGYKIDTPMSPVLSAYQQTMNGVEQMKQDTQTFYLFNHMKFVEKGKQAELDLSNASGTSTVDLTDEALTSHQIHELNAEIPSFARA